MICNGEPRCIGNDGQDFLGRGQVGNNGFRSCATGSKSRERLGELIPSTDKLFWRQRVKNFDGLHLVTEDLERVVVGE